MAALRPQMESIRDESFGAICGPSVLPRPRSFARPLFFQVLMRRRRLMTLFSCWPIEIFVWRGGESVGEPPPTGNAFHAHSPSPFPRSRVVGPHGENGLADLKDHRKDNRCGAASWSRVKASREARLSRNARAQANRAAYRKHIDVGAGKSMPWRSRRDRGKTAEVVRSCDRPQGSESKMPDSIIASLSSAPGEISAEQSRRHHCGFQRFQ